MFEYATSELSQDAFICLLASYAHKNAEKDAAINECARKMLAMFVPELEGKDYKLLEVECKVDNVDVLLTVNCGGKLIVEDKTYTSEHDNQLNRYKEHLTKQHRDTNVEIKGVYYKTGFQNDMSKVIESGYKIIDREKMLQLLGAYIDKTNNKIFKSYYEYWNDKQKLSETYKTLSVLDWGWWAVYGFYDYMDKKLRKDGIKSWYGYVSNPAGRFDCLSVWFGDDEDKLTINNVLCSVYFHLEFYNIYNKLTDKWEKNVKCCLKLQVGAGKAYENYKKKDLTEKN